MKKCPLKEKASTFTFEGLNNENDILESLAIITAKMTIQREDPEPVHLKGKSPGRRPLNTKGLTEIIVANSKRPAGKGSTHTRENIPDSRPHTESQDKTITPQAMTVNTTDSGDVIVSKKKTRRKKRTSAASRPSSGMQFEMYSRLQLSCVDNFYYLFCSAEAGLLNDQCPSIADGTDKTRSEARDAADKPKDVKLSASEHNRATMRMENKKNDIVYGQKHEISMLTSNAEEII